MNEAERVAAAQYAQSLKDRIIWSKYPKLSGIFRDRPAVNDLWIELARLIKELRAS